MIKIKGFRPDIEGLRGIAILFVIAFHCGVPGFAGGFIGVDVFFVLSGYLITGLLVAEIQKTGRLSLMAFYARRVRRLLPASALVLLATLLVGSVVLAPNELTFTGRAARATALYTSNIFFASNTTDYFAPDASTNPMLHTWTLAVEEQFYLLWPLPIMLGLQFWRSSKALAALLLGLVTASLAASVWITSNDGISAFYGLPTRAWEFGIGGLAALLPRGALRLSYGWVITGFLGLVAIIASATFISDPVNFPGWIALIPVLGTVAVLVSSAEQPDHGASFVLQATPIQVLGTLSYSWYLWHWPVLVFLGIFFPNSSLVVKISACALALIVAAAAHRFVENPIRFNSYLVKRPALTLCLGACVTLCSLTAAFLSIRFSTDLANTPAMKMIDSRVGDIADMSRDQCLSSEESTDVKTCIFGDASSSTDIMLFGDSHARQWFNPLRRIVESHGWKLTTILKADCPATDVSPPDLSVRLATTCTIWRATAIRRILEIHPSVVFIGNGTHYLGRKAKMASRSVSLSEWREGTRRTLGRFAAAGLNVVLMRDNPLPPFDVPMCLQRLARHSWYSIGSCEIEKPTALNPAIFEAEKAGAKGLANVHFIDLTDHFCQGENCPLILGGKVVYRDDNHLTGSFADTLMPALQAKLLPLLTLTAADLETDYADMFHDETRVSLASGRAKAGSPKGKNLPGRRLGVYRPESGMPK